MAIREFEILKAQERNSIEVPSSVFINDSGVLKFRNSLNRNFVQVRQGSSSLELSIGGIVGRLPITDTHVIDIAPKFSMANLARLLALSSSELKKRVEVDRLYATTEPDGFLPELILRSLAVFLEKAKADGFHREYMKVTDRTPVRNKINFSKTAQKFWAKGNFTEAVTDQFVFGYDNLENKLLKSACSQGLALTRNTLGFENERRVFAHALNDLSRIPSGSNDHLIAEYMSKISSIPSFKDQLLKAVNLSLELLKRTGVSFNQFEGSLRLPSYLINLEVAFEAYVRNVLKSELQKNSELYRVGDGNLKGWQKQLLDECKDKHPAKPDILIYGENRDTPKLVGDVKYKRAVKVEDRYQIISHALSYRCKTAIIFRPSDNGVSELKKVGKIGPPDFEIDVYEVDFDLSGDMKTEEKRLAERVLSLLN